MSVYMLKFRLNDYRDQLAKATDQAEIDQLEIYISQVKDAIRDVEACEWHDRGWRSRERNA